MKSQNTSQIKGYSESHGVSDVHFINYRYAEKLCDSLAEANVELGHYSGDVSFETIE